jgi:isoquinoline 1-oxidoreductase beta subunit
MKSLKRLMALAGAGAVISILLKKSPMGVVRRFLARQFEDWVPGEVKKIPSPFSWIVITPENQIHLYIPKVEIGQGIHTALAQIIAEELDVGWDQLEVKQATPKQFPDKEGTQSSNSVATLYTVLRQSAAAMRMALADEASRLLGAEITSNGQGLFETADGRTITYGEVIQQGQLKIGPTTNLSLKHREEFQYIGKSMPRIDLLEKVTGRASYGYTYQLPDMLYGAVLSPPAFNGRFEHIDSAAAQALPGVVQVVVDLENQFAGVVAESREMAQRGVACLEVTWADKHLWQQKEIEAIVTVGNGTGVVVQGEETVDRAYQLSAEYRTAMATHAHLEPQSAVADVRSDQAVLYASTQFAWEMRQKVAKRLGLKLEKVTVHSTYVGGGFGNKLNVENGIEAALLSQAVGRPVQLSWTLKDDLRRSYLRPPSHHLLRGSVSNGCIEIFEHEIASGDIGFTYGCPTTRPARTTLCALAFTRTGPTRTSSGSRAAARYRCWATRRKWPAWAAAVVVAVAEVTVAVTRVAREP